MNKNKVSIGINLDSILKESKKISKDCKDSYLIQSKLAHNQKEKKLLKKKLVEEKNILIQDKINSIIKKNNL